MTPLDIDDIKFVINIDFPNQVEDYIHRIGRTGRGNKSGTSLTFVTYENARHVPKLIEVLREANQVISEQLMSLSGQGRGGGESPRHFWLEYIHLQQLIFSLKATRDTDHHVVAEGPTVDKSDLMAKAMTMNGQSMERAMETRLREANGMPKPDP